MRTLLARLTGSGRACGSSRSLPSLLRGGDLSEQRGGVMQKPFNAAIYLALFVVLCDQLSKWWIMRTVAQDHGYAVNAFLNIVHVRNSGMTFGLLSHFDPSITFYFLTGTAGLILFFLGRWLWLTSSGLVAMALGLVI